MTRTARQLMKELEALPEEEQEERAAAYLEDLQRRKGKEKEKNERYAFFKVLKEAELPGPEDASTTYEKKLYGFDSEER